MTVTDDLYPASGLMLRPTIEVTGNRFIGNQNDLIYSQFQDRISSYSHTHNANGGYWSASIGLTETRFVAEEWIKNGLGREITLYSDGAVRWQGFVNSVSVEIGPVSLTVGPMLGIINKMSLTFQTRRYNTNPPIGGVQYRLPYVENTDSQSVYGIFPEIFNAGTGSVEEALAARDRLILEKAWPEYAQSANLGGGGGGASYDIKLECVGYAQFLSKPIYLETGTGTQGASERIVAAIGEEPNGIFSTANIQENTIPVPVPDTDVQNIWDVIKASTVIGDANDNRWLFGVYENASCYYNAIPTDSFYSLSITSNDYIVRDDSGSLVYPWEILPGKWLQVNDLILDPFLRSANSRDPSRVFIESVTYTAPWDISYNGGKTSRVAQQLAKLGVGGEF
jgi:hypothetical protein